MHFVIHSTLSNSIRVATIYPSSALTELTVNNNSISSANFSAVRMSVGTYSQTSGINNAVKINPTYNQTSGTAANTDLLVLRTETAFGSGAQYLLDLQKGGSLNNFATSSLFNVTNQGKIGVGTSTPYWNLQIASSTKTFLTLSDMSAGTDLKHWFLSSQGGNFYLGTSSDAYATSTISALTINSNSRVGVGTTTPFEKFSVQGGIGADYLTITGATNATSTFSTGGINVGNGQFIIEQNSGKLGINTPVTGSLITATTTLSAASGNEIAYQLNYTTNKAAGNDTGLLINMTDTASPGTSYGINYIVGGGNKFSVDNAGNAFAGTEFRANAIIGNLVRSLGNDTTLTLQNRDFTTGTPIGINIAGGTYTNTSNQTIAVKISPTYNQTSGTAANTDLLIQRMELSIGSSTQYLLDLQSGNGVATTSRFNVTNIGKIGIGTTTPYWNMQISTTTPFLTLSDTSSAANLKHWFMSSQGGNFYVGTSSDAYATTTIPALMISKNGNVGIGTTTPGARLSIEGPCGDNDTTGGCADIAELYNSSEAVETGEIIAVDNKSQNSNLKSQTLKENPLVKKASMGDTVIGIVSSNPAMAIEGSALQFLAGTRYENNPMKPAVALAGRVPVKVSLEGGDIKAGDKIALSSISGVGMKATSSGVTIGIALEPINQEILNSKSEILNKSQNTNSNNQTGTRTQIGKILVFVNLGYSKLDIAANDLEKALVVDFESGKIKSSYALDMMDNDLLNVRNILSKSGKWSLDEGGKLIVKEIETERLKIGSPDTPSGITIYDEETSEPYCIKMKGGQMVSTIGECENNLNSQKLNLKNENPNSNTDQPANLIQSIADTEPPIITINGNNPSVINVGVSYADLGASVVDNVSNNLGINYKVDGVELNEIILDTSKDIEHTITYTAMDEAGNIGTAERKVIVEEITQAVIAKEAVLTDTASSTIN